MSEQAYEAPTLAGRALCDLGQQLVEMRADRDALKARAEAAEAALAQAREKCRTVMVASEYDWLLGWRDRFLNPTDNGTDDPTPPDPPDPQTICYVIADAMALREVDAALNP